MHAENFTLEKYCSRIGFHDTTKADFATLSALMRHQLFSVPFENLDVQARKVVSLVPDDIVEKILHHQRGGYCYEVNGIFSMALTSLGIPHHYVAARPMFYPVRRPKTHMAIIADVEGRQWLCDLGFGSYGIRAPMPLDVFDTEVPQDHDTFLLSKSDTGEIVLKAKVDGEWVNQYGFDLSPQEWIDFAPANYMNSTHPDAIFVKQYVVVLQNPQGRKILSGDIFKNVKQGRVEKRQLSPQELPALLAKEFGLVI